MEIKGLVIVICLWAMANADREYTNLWIAEIPGGEGVAQRVAKELGYTYKGQAINFEDHYLFTRDDHPKISTRSGEHLTRALQDLAEVKWAQQEFVIERFPRANIPKQIIQDSKDKKRVQGHTSTVEKFSTLPSAGAGSLDTYEGVTKNIGLYSWKESAYANFFSDPLWTKQWYAQDYRTEDYPVMDHNVVPVYIMGITGKGVTVAVVDDGVQGSHPDLAGNYNYDLSWDHCHDKEGSEPDPADIFGENSHGTGCAGMIAMTGDNPHCGVGVSYEATIAGVKILCRRITWFTESNGLVHKLDDMDIYSNSWGPGDDGTVLGGVDPLSDKALEKGVTKGRGGKGVPYLFAAGNGRHSGDNCGADGYMNHIHTIPVAAVGQTGEVSYYSERCTAVFTTAYSGTYDWMEKTVVTALNEQCSTRFSGTSSATPLIAGIVALALQANPELTYRDVMHLITMSSEVAPLADNGDTWYKNGKGFWVSNDFGFGLLNAENMVRLAQDWTNVPKKSVCITTFNFQDPVSFSVDQGIGLLLESNACEGTDDEVKYLEQVLVTFSISYPYRGAITLKLISPAGTTSDLLEARRNDNATTGFNPWTLKSVHNWGEDPKGKWQLNVIAQSNARIADSTGSVDGSITIAFHGTSEEPSHYSGLPRTYAAFRLANGQTSED